MDISIKKISEIMRNSVYLHYYPLLQIFYIILQSIYFEI